MDDLKNLGLEEMNPTEEKDVNGGFTGNILEGQTIWCCHDIPSGFSSDTVLF